MIHEENHQSPANSPANSPAPPPEHQEYLYADSPPLISAAPPSTAAPPSLNIDEDDDFEFEFAVGSQETRPPIAADEIFSDGQIRPIYPVFDRDLLAGGEGKTRRHPLLQLLIEDRDASTSSNSSLGNDMEGIPSGSYCVWKPGLAQSPEAVRKSSSTGSSRRRRIRDFVLGRSQSDGKEKFVFFAAEEKSSSSVVNEEKRKGKEKKKATELDLTTAHRMFYGGNGASARSGGGGGSAAAAGRKSYLPYKPEIVGFFARVNGVGRTHYPF